MAGFLSVSSKAAALPLLARLTTFGGLDLLNQVDGGGDATLPTRR
ncbi:MAG: hypothetical protein U0797_11290 [Gemmataceae bacterium]